MRLRFALMALLLLRLVDTSRAGGPATQPTLKGLTPKQSMLFWQDHIKSATLDEVIDSCAYTNDKEKLYAKAIAEMEIAVAELQQSAGQK